MGDQRLTGQSNRFCDRFLCHLSSPFFDNRLPSHTAGDLFQNIGYKDPCTAKSGLAMTDGRIRDDVAS